MPRVRFTAAAGRWTALAVALAGFCVSAAQAAPPAPARRGATRAPVGGARPGETHARHREEIDALQRQDVAESLKKHFNIDVDWRVTPLDRLVDIRVRAAKADELQRRLGVSVDWQRYSWIELEALKRTLISFERYRDQHGAPVAGAPSVPAPSAADALVPPTFKGHPVARAGRAVDPDGIIRPTFTGRAEAPVGGTDPDGVIRPTFVVRPRWPSFVNMADPDGLIAPTFLPVRRLSLGTLDDPQGGSDGLMDPTRTLDTRTAPARW